MRKLIGISVLLVVVCGFAAARQPAFLSAYNVHNTLAWTALFGILSVGVAFVIITGGVDLSIGSVVGLVGCLLALALDRGPGGHGWPVWLAVPAVLTVAALLGLLHGLLVTVVRLPPFVVTLCGLLIYRGLARWISGDAPLGFANDLADLRWLATGKLAMPGVAGYTIPVPLLILAGVAAVAAVLLHASVWGRHLLALGHNEAAARYSGVNTVRVTVGAYVLCSLCAGLGGVLFSLDLGSVQPAGHGNFFELYAIAAAVLGGCSLRGGEGHIAGVIIGTALIRVLYNATNLLGVPTQLEFSIIGLVILIGVTADELVRRLAR